MRWIVLFLLFVAPCTAQELPVFTAFLEQQHGLPAGLLSRMEWHESKHNLVTGDYRALDIMSNRQLVLLRRAMVFANRAMSSVTCNEYGAMGAMQITIDVWIAFAVDGNGDGIADPMNRYDSLATAANYLAHLRMRKSLAHALRHYTGRARYATTLLAGLQGETP